MQKRFIFGPLMNKETLEIVEEHIEAAKAMQDHKKDRQLAEGLKIMFDLYHRVEQYYSAGMMLNFNVLSRTVRKGNDTWWHDPKTGEKVVRNRPEMMMLMVSEIAEAMEGYRKNKMDDHLPNRPMEEVEFADLVIRVLDYCGEFHIDLDGAIMEKLAYNRNRADHKPEARLAEGGKKF